MDDNSTFPVKMMRAEVFCLAFNQNPDKVTKDEVKLLLENNHYIHVNVEDIQETVLDWNDNHPLNKVDCGADAYRSYFVADPNQPAFVDRPMRPKTELEKENEELRAENLRLKRKLMTIQAALNGVFEIKE